MIKRTIFITMALFVSSFSFATEHNRTLSLRDTIKDSSVQVPRDVEANLDQLLIDWSKNYQQSTCDRVYSEDVNYPDSVYIERLFSLPSEMELAFNQIVKTYIDMYTSSPRRRASVGYLLAKGDYFFPMIEETLDKYGLPLELKYLSVIESALNPTIKSRMGATGLWQFMLRTGKMYDLEINTLVDERKDPRKSTEAAARYLKDLYDIYGDWNLVIAAYNCGPGNVNKAIRRSGGLTDYWAIYPYLPRETRGYVPGFIAATYIMNYYQKHNICPAENSIYPTMVDTLLVDQHLHLKEVAEKLDMPLEDIRALNPQYQKDVIPGNFKNYTLCLPTKYVSSFISNKSDIVGATQLVAHRKTVDVDESFITTTGKPTKVHKVRRGESLGTIAQKYGVSVSHLKKMNNLSSNKIVAGKNLIINRQQVTKKTEPVKVDNKKVLAEKTKKVEQPKTDEVKEQDESESTSFFAEYYSRMQNDDSDSLSVDIELPADTTLVAEDDVDEILDRNNSEDARTIYHKVRIGETVLQIANKYDVSEKDVLAWNKMSSKKIKIGQRLMIKLPEKPKETEKVEPETEILAEKEKATEPQKEKTVAPKTTAVNKSVSNKASNENKYLTTYYVKKGDSLYIIAKKFKGVSSNDIMLANNLKNDKLSIGQKLKIPLN